MSAGLPPFDPPLPEAVQRLAGEGREAELEARREEARDRYEAALRALPRCGYASAASWLLRWIGRTWSEGGDAQAALDCLEAALAVAQAAGDPDAIASALNAKATTHFHRGELDDSETLLRSARTLAHGTGNRKMLAMVEQNLANVASIRGDAELALVQYESSLAGYRALGLNDYVGPLLSNIGRIRTDVGDWSGAGRALDEARAWCTRTGDRSHEVLVEVTRARLMVASGEMEGALHACEEAEELALSAGDDRWAAEIWRHYGTIHARNGRPHLAVEYLRRSRESADAHHDLLAGAETAREQAVVFRALQRNQDSLRSLNESLRLFEVLRARRELADVDQRLARLQGDFLDIVRGWGESIESKDAYTLGHCGRVAYWACELAAAAGLDERTMVWFRMGALLHDVGKVDVPLSILNKPGPLTRAERSVIEYHPVRGIELLGDVEFPWDVKPMVRHHHERWDGRGYPDGLAGEEIPWTARVLTLADVYDALTTDRAYRKGFSTEKALEIMAEETGRGNDPELVPLFREVVTGARARVAAGPPVSFSTAGGIEVAFG